MLLNLCLRQTCNMIMTYIGYMHITIFFFFVTFQGKDTADPISLELKRLAVRDAQVCTYLFHHASDSNLRNERLVWTMGLTASRAELKCLRPGEPINEVV
jgi:hypothetical protein